MAGLQSLIQGGNKPAMPGQAGAFTALPAQQGRNPVAYTRALKQIPAEDLIRIYNDPNDLRPKWAVASAYADAMKAKALQQGMQGQQAMAQNVAAQQKPPVADELMTRMAASGGEMKSYQYGGDVEEDIVAQLSGEFGGEGIDQAERDAQEEQKRRQEIRERFQFVQGAGSEPAVQRMLQQYPWLAQERAAAQAPSRTTASPSPAAAGSAAGVRDIQRLTPIFTPPAATSPAAEAPEGLSPHSQRLEKAEEERNRIVREGANISPEVMAARRRMEQLSAGRLQQSQQDAEKIRSERIRQLQGSLDAARRPLIDDPEALLSLAASINPQRGKTMGSLAGGLSSILAGRRARAEKAEEGISVLNEKVRLLNSQYQEAEALEEQRKYAILTRDADLKRETEQKIADNNVRMRQTQAEIDTRLQDVKARESAARASRESAAQGREMIGLQRLTVALDNRNKTYQKARADWLNSTPVKLAQMAASAPNAPKEKTDAWEKMQQDFETSFKNSQEIRNLDAAISRMSQEAGVPMPSSVNTAGWSIEKVKTPGQE